MKVTLKDGSPRKKGEANITVSKNGNMLEIGADGYGEHGAEQGHGFPIVLEFYDGRLRLLVFSDINSEDPTHTIDLEGARESKRKPDPDTLQPGSPAPYDGLAPKQRKKTAVEPTQATNEQAAPVAKAPAVEPTDDELEAFDAA